MYRAGTEIAPVAAPVVPPKCINDVPSPSSSLPFAFLFRIPESMGELSITGLIREVENLPANLLVGSTYIV